MGGLPEEATEGVGGLEVVEGVEVDRLTRSFFISEVHDIAKLEADDFP